MSERVRVLPDGSGRATRVEQTDKPERRRCYSPAMGSLVYVVMRPIVPACGP